MASFAHRALLWYLEANYLPPQDGPSIPLFLRYVVLIEIDMDIDSTPRVGHGKVNVNSCGIGSGCHQWQRPGPVSHLTPVILGAKSCEKR